MKISKFVFSNKFVYKLRCLSIISPVYKQNYSAPVRVKKKRWYFDDMPHIKYGFVDTVPKPFQCFAQKSQLNYLKKGMAPSFSQGQKPPSPLVKSVRSALRHPLSKKIC